jgi:hypothetical protein
VGAVTVLEVVSDFTSENPDQEGLQPTGPLFAGKRELYGTVRAYTGNGEKSGIPEIWIFF